MQTKETPKVSIILIGMNNKKLVNDCLNSLKEKTSYKNYNVIFADNGSTDGTIEMIKERFKEVDLIENGKNLGFAGGNNVGIKYALKKYDSDYYLLLNNDTIIIQKDWLENMVLVGEKISDAGVIGCKLIYPDKSLQYYAINNKNYGYAKGEKPRLSKTEEKEEKKESNKIQEVNHVVGAAFMINKKLINKIGLLDPDYFPIYGEEIDYCDRARKNGFRRVYTPHATIVHIRGQTTNPKKITKHWYFSKKNSIMLELSNYNLLEIIYWQIVHFGAVFLSKEKGKIKIRKDFLMRFLFLIKAYFENVLRLLKILHKRYHRDEKIGI